MAATSFHKAAQLGFVGCPKATGGAFCDASQHSGLRLNSCTHLSAGALKWDLVQQSLKKGRTSGLETCPWSRRRCAASARDRSNSDAGGSADFGSEPSSNEDAAPVLKADWRTFRAKLVAQEHLSEPGPSAESPSFSDNSSEQRTVQIQGREWAHPIQEPEKGCLLLASTELDGDHYFDRAVILVLDHSDEGTFGVILNRPMPFTVDGVKGLPREFKDRFKDERVFFGGPMNPGKKIFAVSGESSGGGFEEVVPGVFFGETWACWRLADLIARGKAKASSFRFCVGYAGWGPGQLAQELTDGFWQLAACSADIITQPLRLEQVEGSITQRSGVGLWELVHELMGGPYAEISRKSKSDRGSGQRDF